MNTTDSTQISSAANGERLDLVRKTNLRLAIKDLIDGFMSFHLWSMLAWQEIQQRYRRSVIGPFWLTLSTGVMIGAMGPLYAKLFGQTMDKYFGYLATSMVVWQFISETIRESCQAFIGAEGFIKQVKLPLSIQVLRIVWKGLIVFAHNLVIVALVFVFYPPQFGPGMLLLPFGILAVSLNAIWLGIVIGLICARFRDFPQIINNLISVAFFLTPIMWNSELLGRYAWTVNLNPFFHLMEVIREPLLGTPFRAYSWLAIVVMTVVGYALMIAIFGRFRSRIAYWI